MTQPITHRFENDPIRHHHERIAKCTNYKIMCVIKDPLGQTHSTSSSDHYSHLKFVLFCEILKRGDGRTDGRTDGLWVGLVDQIGNVNLLTGECSWAGSGPLPT